MSKEAAMFNAKRKQTFNAAGRKMPKLPDLSLDPDPMYAESPPEKCREVCDYADGTRTGGYVIPDELKTAMVDWAKHTLGPEPVTPDAPLVLTDTRAPTILTVEQANAKAASMRTEIGEKQIDELMESGGPAAAPRMMEWPESPDAGARMFNAIMDGLRIGGAHLSSPIDEKGNRRVIWRGQPTHVILSADLCWTKFGISRSSKIISPFDDGVPIGAIEIA